MNNNAPPLPDAPPPQPAPPLDPNNPADHAIVLDRLLTGQTQTNTVLAAVHVVLMRLAEVIFNPTVTAAINTATAAAATSATFTSPTNDATAPLPPPLPQPSSSSSSSAHLPRPEKPDKFDGSRKANANLDAWLHAMRTYLKNSGLDLNSALAVEYAAGFLTGNALSWFNSERLRNPDSLPDSAGFSSFSSFSDALRRSLGVLDPELKAREDLKAIRQESSVDDYASRFQRIISHLPNYEPAAATYYFFDGLKPKIKERLITQVDLKNDSWLQIRDKAASLDNILWKSTSSTSSTARHHSGPTPMDTSINNVTSSRGRSSAPRNTTSSRPRSPTPAHRSSSPAPSRLAPLTDADRAYLRANNGCFRCRKINVDHISKNCPGTTSTAAASRGRSPSPKN